MHRKKLEVLRRRRAMNSAPKSSREAETMNWCEATHKACDFPALWWDNRLMMDFCSKSCADKEIKKRQRVAELDRLAEIESGGQV